MGNVDAKIKAIYFNSEFHTSTTSLAPQTRFGIILDQTNFYAESGGQENDTGRIVIDGKTDFVVDDVQVYNGYVLHVGTLSEGSLTLEDEVVSTYDEERRWPLRNNHTGTHILNFALRAVLGNHIDQKGSLVAPAKLRYDFSHKAPVSHLELIKIEAIANQWISKNVKVFSKEVSLKEAMEINGLRAVFGETYPDPVRVVSLEFEAEEMLKDPTSVKWMETSTEFCGGTFVLISLYR